MTVYDQGLNLPVRDENSLSWYRKGMLSRAACYVYDEYKHFCEEGDQSNDRDINHVLAEGYEAAWDTLEDAAIAMTGEFESDAPACEAPKRTSVATLDLEE